MWYTKRTEDLNRIVMQLAKWVREEKDDEAKRRAHRAQTTLLNLLDELADEEVEAHIAERANR